MNATTSIRIDHLARVEGHGSVDIRIRDGIVERCQWQVVEAPRFFEAMLRGRKWYEVAHVASRICGICSIGHTLASLKATEAAMGVRVSEPVVGLRKLLLHAENIQSHVLHLGYLVLPDLFKAPSVIPLAATHRPQVLLAIGLHRLANEMSALLGGRTTHPQSAVVGGFARWPTPGALAQLRSRLEAALPQGIALAQFIAEHAGALPAFQRETEFIALADPHEYAFYDGRIGSTEGGTFAVDRYRGVCNEYCVPQSTAKYAKHRRDSYMVGALARINLNYDCLGPNARSVAAMFGLRPISHNPFMNNAAQVVEVVHCLEDSIQRIDELLKNGVHPEKASAAVRAGRATGCVEVPRGILFHEYEYSPSGECVWANCVIPTNQNHANIQKDMEALVEQFKDRPAEEIEFMVEMLVRAYDPCISCSTH
jgi:coenzyme F420-reducing hydrogenase alpha subunit